MGPWGRIFPRRISGRCVRAPGPPNRGFGARSGGTWPDPRLGTPRGPSGGIFARRPQGGSGRAVRAPGGRVRPEYTCFPVAPGLLRGPETPIPGRRRGRRGRPGPKGRPEWRRKRHGAPPARGVSIASGQATRLRPKCRRKRHRAPPARGVNIASGQAIRLLASQNGAWFCRRGCLSRGHTRQGLRNGCPEERARRLLTIIPTDGPARSEFKECREPKPKRSEEPNGVAGTKACGSDVRKNARRARWNRHPRRRRAAWHFLHRCVI